jgi:hypothetical protein
VAIVGSRFRYRVNLSHLGQASPQKRQFTLAAVVTGAETVLAATPWPCLPTRLTTSIRTNRRVEGAYRVRCSLSSGNPPLTCAQVAIAGERTALSREEPALTG